MGRTRVRTRSRTSTDTAVTFVNNELMRAFITIGNAAGADTSFIRENRKALTTIFDLGLEYQLIEEVKVEFTTSLGRVLETWVFEVSYDGSEPLVEIPVNKVCNEVSNLEEDSLFDIHVIVKPIVEGVPIFTANDDPIETIASFGGGGIDVNIGRKR